MEPKKQAAWPVVLFIVIVAYAFTYGGIWIGLGITLAGLIMLGWDRRHDGPLPTNRRN